MLSGTQTGYREELPRTTAQMTTIIMRFLDIFMVLARNVRLSTSLVFKSMKDERDEMGGFPMLAYEMVAGAMGSG